MKIKSRKTHFKQVDPSSGITSTLSQTFGAAKSSEQRGVVNRHFAGAIACAKSNNSNAATVSLYHTIDSTSYLMDTVTLQPGESAIWNEDDYGIVLQKTHSITMGIGGDVVNCWIKTYDTYL
tara:strand:+ start:41 stop:406 length:366 start_codon:yes stop_codon:yes gene_type:complete